MSDADRMQQMNQQADGGIMKDTVITITRYQLNKYAVDMFLYGTLLGAVLAVAATLFGVQWLRGW